MSDSEKRSSESEALLRQGEEWSPAVLAQIERALRGLKFGTVSIVVHDGAIVQIDRTEKVRLK